MKKQLLALSFMLVAGAAVAQNAPVLPVARIVSTNGLVTIGSGGTLSNAAVDMQLFQGSNVLITSTGTAELLFTGGCRITLNPGDVFQVSEANCRSLLASRAGANPSLGGLPGLNPVIVGGVVVGVGVVVAGKKQSGS